MASPSTGGDTPASQGAGSLATLAPELLIGIIGAVIQTVLRSQVNVRKDEVAWALNNIARIVRSSEKALTQQNQGSLAHYADTAAQQLEAASGYLHGHDFQQIMHDVEQLAKERPVVFMGATLTVGLITARFLKNTGSHE